MNPFLVYILLDVEPLVLDVEPIYYSTGILVQRLDIHRCWTSVYCNHWKFLILNCLHINGLILYYECIYIYIFMWNQIIKAWIDLCTFTIQLVSLQTTSRQDSDLDRPM
jgi:hypothetical protein